MADRWYYAARGRAQGPSPREVASAKKKRSRREGHPGPCLRRPEVLRYDEVPDPEPRAGEAIVRVEAVGVSFIDAYHRTGAYKAALPMTLGQEGAAPSRPSRRASSSWCRATASPGPASSARTPRRRPCRRPDWSGFRRRDGAPGRRGDAPGNDGALPGLLDVPVETRRHLPRARGRGRRRLAARPDREAAGRNGHRDGLQRGEGPARPRGGRRRDDRLRRERIRGGQRDA